MSAPITTAEVADRLGISARTVIRYAASGDLPTVGKLAGLRGPWLFDPDVVALFARQRGNGRKKAS